MKKKLCKSRKNKIVDGVCAGVGNYFNIDPTIVRLVMVGICCLKGAGFLLYIIACILMPYEDDSFSSDDVDNLKSANVDSEKDGKTEKTEAKKEGLHSDEDFNSFFDK